MGSQRVGHDWVTNTHTYIACVWVSICVAAFLRCLTLFKEKSEDNCFTTLVGFCCTVMGISHNYTLPLEPPSHLCIFLIDKSWVYPHISNSHCALPGFSSLINLASFSCAENLSSQTKYLSDLSDVSFKTQDKTATTTIMKMFLEFFRLFLFVL